MLLWPTDRVRRRGRRLRPRRSGGRSGGPAPDPRDRTVERDGLRQRIAPRARAAAPSPRQSADADPRLPRSARMGSAPDRRLGNRVGCAEGAGRLRCRPLVPPAIPGSGGVARQGDHDPPGRPAHRERGSSWRADHCARHPGADGPRPATTGLRRRKQRTAVRGELDPVDARRRSRPANRGTGPDHHATDSVRRSVVPRLPAALPARRHRVNRGAADDSVPRPQPRARPRPGRADHGLPRRVRHGLLAEGV